VLTDADLERAAICFGAAQHVRHMIASPLPPSEKQLCDQAIKRIRAGLSDGAFEAAWQWGQTTPVDEIATRLLGRLNLASASCMGFMPVALTAVAAITLSGVAES